jgi:hypothetical protein
MSVPDKRQDSKQRRQARNRASREALAARRDNVASGGTSGASSGGGSTGGTTAGTTAGAPRRGGLLGGLLGGGGGRQPRAAAPQPVAAPPGTGFLWLKGRRPGDIAVLVAMLLAIVSTIVVLLLPVPVDDRGDPIPRSGGGLYEAGREALIGHPLPDESRSILAAQGPGILIVLLLPVAICGFAVWANRRPDRSRMLTFAMLGMAGAVLLGVGQFFLPSLIALGVAGFRARRADMPAMPGRPGRPARPGRGGAIDADSREIDADAPAHEPEDADLGDEPDGPDDDVLAELEAEIDAERAESNGGDQGKSGRGKRGR